MSALTRRTTALPPLPDTRTTFVVHAVLALLAIGALHALAAAWVPLAIKGIGASYLIFFWHFPSAINVFLFYAAVCVFSIAYLATRNAKWDVRARGAAAVGLLANAVLLATGSVWAKAAWNQWWVWDDPRLLSAAVMSLIYVGYAVLQRSVEDAEKRRTSAAVFGILAIVNVPIVYWSIEWFGAVSHPEKFDQLSDPRIVATRWIGVLAFLVLYLLLYRWKHHGDLVRERTEDALQRVRRLEEGVSRR